MTCMLYSFRLHVGEKGEEDGLKGGDVSQDGNSVLNRERNTIMNILIKL